MMENSKGKTVDLRIKRSRKSLIDALCDLMQEKPFQKISITEVAERAMVNRSTFYAHFVDKYDLLAVAVRQRIRGDLAAALVGADAFTEDNLRKLIVVTHDIMAKIVAMFSPTPTNEMKPLILAEMQSCIYEVTLGWANTHPKTAWHTVSAETVAMVCTGAIFGAVSLWARQHTMMTRDQLTDETMQLLIGGIAALARPVEPAH